MVAVDAKGNPYSPNAVSLAFTRFIQAHHLPKITLHGLRHTFATVASAQGAPLFDIGSPGPLHPRHHGQDLHPPAGSEPHRHPGPGGKCAEITPGARMKNIRAPGAFPQKMVQSMQSSALLRCV